jgi:septal ring factor EnvC (AmiA/AmiB activator)
MAQEADLRYLSELLAQIEDDVREIKSDMAEVRASSTRIRNGVASLKEDVARLDTKLDACQVAVIDRFDRFEDLLTSFSRFPIAQQPAGCEITPKNKPSSTS